jgi:hypothetical protein
MAVTYYGINIGETTVTVGTSTTSKDIELAVDDTNSPNNLDVAIALKEIAHQVEHG